MAISQLSSPLLKKFTHANFTVGLSETNVIGPEAPGVARVSTIIQNTHGSNTLTVILNDTGTTGFVIQPATFFSIDNYCGTVRLKGSGAGTTVHIAYATV